MMSTVEQVHRACIAGTVPVNVGLAIAIEAHQCRPDFMTLRTIIMARVANTEEERQKLDYMSALPESAWGGFLNRRQQILDVLRRSISWSTICA